MRWYDERIAEEIDAVWCRDGELRGGNVRPLMVAMRDDYERALLGQRVEAVKLAQQVAELEAAHDARGLGALALAESRGHVDERIVLGRRIFELEQQLAAALATIERACGKEMPDGKLYAEGCAPE